MKSGKATAALRRTMVERQLRPFDVTDLPVLNRFLNVPREAFLPPSLAAVAYSDLAWPAKAPRRFVRAPCRRLCLARFLQSAEIRPHHKVLDIAGGALSGGFAVGLAAEVVALETIRSLPSRRGRNLAKVGATQVRVPVGPLEKGAPEQALRRDLIPWSGRGRTGRPCRISSTGKRHILAYRQSFSGDSGMKVVRLERSEAAGERTV